MQKKNNLLVFTEHTWKREEFKLPSHWGRRWTPDWKKENKSFCKVTVERVVISMKMS